MSTPDLRRPRRPVELAPTGGPDVDLVRLQVHLERIAELQPRMERIEILLSLQAQQLARVVQILEARDGLEVERVRAEIEGRRSNRTWLQGVLSSDRVVTGLVAGLSGLLTALGTAIAAWWGRPAPPPPGGQ